MNSIRLFIGIITLILFFVTMYFILTNSPLYYNIEKTGKQICHNICIEGDIQTPCDCEEKVIYHTLPTCWIIPGVMVVLSLLNFLIPYKE